MRKLLFLIIILVGCTNVSNTPIKQTEEFFKKYQILDEKVINDLNEVVDNDLIMSDDQKEKYQKIMQNHYQNLTYNIKEDTIDANKAEVITEIEVTDFYTVLEKANQYLIENSNEFTNEQGDYDNKKFIDYRLEQMEKTNQKVIYTVKITLELQDEKWSIIIDDNTIYDKINGNYGN